MLATYPGLQHGSALTQLLSVCELHKIIPLLGRVEIGKQAGSTAQAQRAQPGLDGWSDEEQPHIYFDKYKIDP